MNGSNLVFEQVYDPCSPQNMNSYLESPFSALDDSRDSHTKDDGVVRARWRGRARPEILTLGERKEGAREVETIETTITAALVEGADVGEEFPVRVEDAKGIEEGEGRYHLVHRDLSFIPPTWFR